MHPLNSIFWIAKVTMVIALAACGTEGRDFKDMGIPRTRAEKSDGTPKTASESREGTQESGTDAPRKLTLDEERSNVYFRRIIQTFLNRLGDQYLFSNTKEVRHLELPVTLGLAEYNQLSNFVNHKDDTSYQEVDTIFLNILHPASEPSKYSFIWNMSVVEFVEIGLLTTSLSTAIYIFTIVLVRFINSGGNDFIRICLVFAIICIFSYAWTFLSSYQEAVAKVNTSRGAWIEQCGDIGESKGAKHWDGITGYLSIQLYGYTNKCNQLYIGGYKDPIWSVNPLEVFARSLAGLLFSQMPYIGDMLGGFLSNIMFIVPVWLRPIMFLPTLCLAVIGLFGLRVSTPFFAITLGNERLPPENINPQGIRRARR